MIISIISFYPIIGGRVTAATHKYLNYPLITILRIRLRFARGK